MGFDIQRFEEQNIDKEFICMICRDVLEDPLVISTCEHMYCSRCIMACIKAHGVCPQDRSVVSISKLEKPVRVLKNLIDKLKIRCTFEGCPVILTLGEINNHSEKCDSNPENKKIKCFCDNEFTFSAFNEHKDNCLEYQKNELSVTRAQLTTFTSSLLSSISQISEKVTSDSGIKPLFINLKLKMANKAMSDNAIHKILLYISSKLLMDEIEKEKDLLSTIRYVKYGFEDLSIATDRNYDNCYDFIETNGLNYLFLCQDQFKNKHINRFMAQILKNISKFEDLMLSLMNKKCLKMVLTLMHERNDIKTCIDSAEILSDIVLMGSDIWKQQIRDYRRQNMLKEFKANVFKLHLNQTIEISLDSMKELFNKIRSNNCTLEVSAFYVWLLANAIKTSPEKTIPNFELENGFNILKGLEERLQTENHSKRCLEIIFNKWFEWKERQQKSSNSTQII